MGALLRMCNVLAARVLLLPFFFFFFLCLITWTQKILTKHLFFHINLLISLICSDGWMKCQARLGSASTKHMVSFLGPLHSCLVIMYSFELSLSLSLVRLSKDFFSLVYGLCSQNCPQQKVQNMKSKFKVRLLNGDFRITKPSGSCEKGGWQGVWYRIKHFNNKQIRKYVFGGEVFENKNETKTRQK